MLKLPSNWRTACKSISFFYNRGSPMSKLKSPGAAACRGTSARCPIPAKSQIDEYTKQTVPWNCSRCGCEIILPIDTAFPGKFVECRHCGKHWVLAHKSYPAVCDVCGNTFHPLKRTVVLGGIAQCPTCGTIYRRAVRSIAENKAQMSGQLLPQWNKRYVK